MNRRLADATTQTQSLVARMGRAATPAVRDAGMSLTALPPAVVPAPGWPTLVVGDPAPLADRGILTLAAHPNTVTGLASAPEAFQALVVNGRALGGPWAGALSGAAVWKANLIYDLCVAWRRAGLPAYLVRPSVETTPLYRWASVSTTVAPWTPDDAEETGNEPTPLWLALESWGAAL